jgi:TolB protein
MLGSASRGHAGRALLIGAAFLSFVAVRGSEAHGAAKPALHANGRIAFADASSGGIASMNPDGSGQWGVELNVSDISPAWSPDGSQLAVVTHWAGRNGILVMQPDGSDQRLVTTDSGDTDPAWSPDGSKIAFADGQNIYVVSADGTGRRQMTSNDYGYAAHPTWSPDGTTIAYSLYTDRTFDGVETYRSGIVLLDVTSGKQTTLLAGPNEDDYTPAWSPDGSSIAFAKTENYGNARIYTVNPDGTHLTALTDGSSWDATPAWSPDATKLLFVRNQQIWVIGRDGTGSQQLSNSTGGGVTPAWQPLGPRPAGCTLWGTNGNDLLVGTDGRDVICGLGGSDTLIGLGGDDTLAGGDGNDYLAGGLGRDRLIGGADDDTLDARDDGASDLVQGGTGWDKALVDGRVDQRQAVEQTTVDRDLAAWHPVTADAFLAENPPIEAFDGRIGDWWNSGGYPTHWIEVDLLRSVSIGRVSFVTPELPTGATFMLLGRATSDGAFRLLHVFKGPTVDLQRIVYSPKRPWRGIHYLRVVVPQSHAAMPWVSWREIKVYAPTCSCGS